MEGWLLADEGVLNLPKCATIGVPMPKARDVRRWASPN